ncbi:ATP synthase alpha/beta family, beta-barrel domain protein, partial [Chlamydia psittaci 01DC11]
MPIKPNELSEIIKDQIKNFEKDVRVLETGKVIAVGDGIVLASGLNNVEYGEIVKFESGILGMALNLE